MRQNNYSSLGALLILLALLLVLGSFAVSIYGLYLAFSASIILGLIVLFVEPSPFILGLVMLVWNKDLAQALIDWFSK